MIFKERKNKESVQSQRETEAKIKIDEGKKRSLSTKANKTGQYNDRFFMFLYF